MSDTFQFKGQLKVFPPPSALDNSANPSINEDILEQQTVTYGQQQFYTLTTDSPVTVDLSNIGLVTAIQIKALGGRVKATVTSADGTSQAIPLDFGVLMCGEVPYTALTLTRPTGTQITVRVILAG